MTDDILIINAFRTAIGSFNGYYKNVTAPELASYTIHANYEHAGINANHIDLVTIGCVLSAGLGQAPARQAALKANLPINTPCITVNKMCGSGLQAVIQTHDAILAKSVRIAVAGGMENMTQAPYLIPKARFGYRFGHAEILDHMQYDGLEDAYSHKSMGLYAEACVKEFNFSREALDIFAKTSVERAIAATKRGDFKDEIVPIIINEEKINRDEGILKAKPEKIAKLKPAFDPNGSITAANSSSISDGAASLLLASATQVHKLNLTPMAIIKGHATHAQSPEWFTTAPIDTIKKLLNKINWSINDIDLFEINEAFACVTMATMEALKIPQDKVNIHGGACVLGHPIGASGARILTTLIHTLKQRHLKRGVAALCIGGGEAQAIAIELT